MGQEGTQASPGVLGARQRLVADQSRTAPDRASRPLRASLQGSNALVAIDLAAHRVVPRLPVGTQPAGVWVTSDDRLVLVGIMGEDHVAVVDRHEHRVIDRIVTGKGAHNVLQHADQRHVFVSNRVANTVAVLDHQARKVVETW